jgi:hypothetical protein
MNFVMFKYSSAPKPTPKTVPSQSSLMLVGGNACLSAAQATALPCFFQ